MGELELLIKAREFQAMGLSKGAFARDARGHAVGRNAATNGVCFCPVGALYRASHDHANLPAAVSRLGGAVLVRDANGGLSPMAKVMIFADDPRTTLQDVLDLFDRSIEQCKQSLTTT